MGPNAQAGDGRKFYSTDSGWKVSVARAERIPARRMTQEADRQHIMGYLVNDTVGLIIAFLNVATIVALIYCFLQTVGDDRSRLLGILDKGLSPILAPLRRFLPRRGFDFSPVILAVLLQAAAALIKRGW